MALVVSAGALAGVVAPASPSVKATHASIKLPFAAGADWYVSQGYNTSPVEGWSHYNCDPRTGKDEISQSQSCDDGWQYKYSFDLRRSDGAEAGQPVLSPVDGTIRWIDEYHGGMSIDLGDGYAVAFFHADLARGLEAGQAVRQGQRLGVVSGPGGGANGGTPHIHLTLWRTEDGGNWSRIAVPFTDEHALDGYDFPALGERERNQHWNAVVVSSNRDAGGGDAGTPSSDSTPAPTTTPAPLPATPILTEPADGTRLAADQAPTLAWEPAAEALEYQVVIDRGERTGPWQAATNWSPGTLPAGRYVWQVRARNWAGESRLSEPRTFTVEADTGSPAEAKRPDREATPEATAPAAGPASLTLAAAEAVVGTRLTVNGAGFAAGETVTLYWDSVDAPAVGEATANEVGAWTTSLPVPNAVGGAHRVIARGASSGLEADGDFTIAPSLTREPVAGAPGTAVTVGLAGFGAEEAVDLRWQSEDGASLGGATTDAAGAATAQISIPEAADGAYDLVAVGQNSGARAFATVRVAAEAASLEAAAVGGSRGEIVAGGSMLGPGTFQVTATVEGLVGGTTSSGRTIQPNDRFVSLPACTATSCPWLTPGVTDPTWGTRIECGDACYVRVTNPATNQCAVAPVLETGPWFTLDDWWNPAEVRTLNNLPTTVNRLAQGYAGADAALDGLDVGFGRSPDGIGFSNKGYEVGNRSAIDLANGTWQDVGFDLNVGIGTVVVTMLWQSGESPDAAAVGCGTAAAATPETTPDATPADETDIDEAIPAAEPTEDTAKAAAVATEQAAAERTAVEPTPTPDVTSTPDATATQEATTVEATIAKANEKLAEYGLDPIPTDAEVTTGDEGAVGTVVPVVAGVSSDDGSTGDGGTEGAPAGDGSAGEDVPTGVEAIGPKEAEATANDQRTAVPPLDEGEKDEIAPVDSVSDDGASENGAVEDASADVESEQTVDTVLSDLAADPAADAAADSYSAEAAAEPPIDAEADAAAGDVEETFDPPPAEAITEPVVAPEPVPLEIVFFPVADTSVAAAEPERAQAPERLATLAVGGAAGEAAYVTFQVVGVAPGSVLDARLVLTGTGDAGGSAGVLGALPGVWVDEATTYLAAPSAGAPALAATGTPASVDWLQPGVETVIDVTGTVAADGTITFALFGTPEAPAAFASRESAAPPRLVVTVAGAPA